MIGASMLKIISFSVTIFLSIWATNLNAQTSHPYYENLSPELRVSLQRSLLWTGHFSGIADGIFGQLSIEAAQRYQSSIGARPNGLITKEQALSLLRQASRVREEFGYRLFNDPFTGATIGLPEKFVKFNGLNKRGSQFVSTSGAVDMTTLRIPESERTLGDLFRLHMTRQGRAVTYRAFRDDWFVVSGRENGKRFYVRAHRWNGDIRGFAISYPDHLGEVFDRLTIAMSSDFKPDSSTLSVAQSAMTNADVERMFGPRDNEAARSTPQIASAPRPAMPAPPKTDGVITIPEPREPAKGSQPAVGGPFEPIKAEFTTGTGFLVSR